MGSIVHIDTGGIPWADYAVDDRAGPPPVRVKALSQRSGGGTPPMQYVEYAPGHADRVHSHDEGEVFIVTAGELRLGDRVSGPGSVVYIPKGTEYAMQSGDDGLTFYRIVVP